MDLLILKRAFDAVPAKLMEGFIEATPSGAVTRRTWFFYELLTGKRLDLDDAKTRAPIDALDPDLYFTIEGTLSRRHRVRDNLLGHGRLLSGHPQNGDS